MFARALLAFLALPGVVAFAVPVALVSRELSHSAGAATGLGAAGGRFCRAALVCSRLLRFRQGHSCSVGTTSTSCYCGPVSLHSQSHVCRCRSHTSGLGGVVRLAWLVPLHYHRGHSVWFWAKSRGWLALMARSGKSIRVEFLAGSGEHHVQREADAQRRGRFASSFTVLLGALLALGKGSASPRCFLPPTQRAANT
jgi:hypothetical protein